MYGCSVTLWIIRHAETVSNVQPDSIGGHNLNTPLTPDGESEAQSLGTRLEHEGVTFQAAYCSTALRAKKTAEHCFTMMGHAPPLSSDDRLLEQDKGGWEGKSRAIYQRADVKAGLEEDCWTYVPGDDKPGESQKMVAERMIKWVKEKVAEHSSEGVDQHIMVITHCNSIRFLLAELLDERPRTAQKEFIHNTSITKLCFEGQTLVLPLGTRNCTAHLQKH